MRNFSTKKMVLAGFFIALGLVLPFLTGQIQSIGNKLLPMHIPVLLCGFVCGWPIGLIVGFVVPVLRSILFGMPPMFPVALAMAFELATYGFIAGLLYQRLPKTDANIFVSLILSMISGRMVWGIVSYFLYGFSGTAFSWSMFTAGAFINAIPGIIIQIILIPAVIIALKKANLMQDA